MNKLGPNIFTPLAFAAMCAANTNDGILFIQTSNDGGVLRYEDEFRPLGEQVINSLMQFGIAIINTTGFHVSTHLFNQIAFANGTGGCLSYAAVFIGRDSKVRGSWSGGEYGESMSEDQLNILRSL